MQINDFLTYLGHLILIACNPPDWVIVVHIDSILFCYICPQKAVKKNVVRKKYVKTFYCDLILLLRQNKSDDRFSKNSSFRILDSYFRMCLQLLMHKKTRFTSYSKWCRNISWRRQFMIWHRFEFLLTGLLILEILFILYISADFHCPRTCLQNWYPFPKKLRCPLMQNSTFALSLSEKN